MSGPRLETERLLLRPPLAEDAPAHAEMMADPLTAAFLTLDGKPQDKAMAWRTFAFLVGHWSLRGFGFFSMIDKETGRWAGRTGPWMPEGWPDLEIGWGVHPAFRGKAYALEAAVASARYAFDVMGRQRIISLIRPNNTNSRRVAEKLGEGISGQVELFGFPADVWSISRERFEAKWG
ncbi:MAG: GNAT family N-acetyltransferase [Caulobacterales bacterium]